MSQEYTIRINFHDAVEADAARLALDELDRDISLGGDDVDAQVIFDTCLFGGQSPREFWEDELKPLLDAAGLYPISIEFGVFDYCEVETIDLANDRDCGDQPKHLTGGKSQ